MQVDRKYCKSCSFNKETIFKNLQEEPERSHPSSKIKRYAYNQNFVRFLSFKDFGKEAQTELDTLTNHRKWRIFHTNIDHLIGLLKGSIVPRTHRASWRRILHNDSMMIKNKTKQ